MTGKALPGATRTANTAGRVRRYGLHPGSVRPTLSMGTRCFDRGGTMNDSDTRVARRGGRMRIPRSRGATSGFLLVLLGLWGALIPFVGPYFNFAFTPDQAWVWTT